MKQINKKFMRNLRKKFGDKTFTNFQAYIVYFDKHARDPLSLDNCWLQMNVRRYLCAMADEGILTRIKPGVYKFA